MDNLEKRFSNPTERPPVSEIEPEQETAEIPDILRTHLGESESPKEEFGGIAPEDRPWAEKELNQKLSSPEWQRRYPDIEERRRAIMNDIRGEAGYRQGKPGWFEGEE